MSDLEQQPENMPREPGNATTVCPECGAELDVAAAGQPCPACLMKLGLQSWQSRGAVGDSLEETSDSKPRAFEPPAPEELAGKLPNLEVLELLGHGGMGAVYKGRQTSLDRIVAIKLIRPDAADLPGFAERFTREARALAKLNHPNIVMVHDFGKVPRSSLESSHLAPRDEPAAVHATEPSETSSIPHTSSLHEPALSDTGEPSGGPAHLAERDGYVEGPLYYLVMEYVDGTDLRHLIAGGELSPEQALAIVPSICEALQFAHDAGIVHRDIKPENILIDQSGRVKIADFGLARLAGGEASAFTLTGTRQIMGTLRYMAPEQMEASHSVDHRADIYSLGVVFYEMLTGQVPAGHFDPPSKKVHVDVRLDEVVLRSLAREPERRYQHASDVKSDLDAISSGAAALPLVSAVAPPAWTPPPICRQVIPAAGLLAVFIFCAAATAVSFLSDLPLLGLFVMLSVVFGIASSSFGFIAISQLRSHRHLGGVGLAFTAAFAFPATVVTGGCIVFFKDAGVSPSAMLGAGILLLLFDVAALTFFWMLLRPDRQTSPPFPRAVFLAEFFILTAVFALTTFAMVWEQSAWPVCLLVVSWLVMAGFGAYHDNTPQHRATLPNFVFGTLCSVGLLGYAVTLAGSQALLAVLLCVVGMVFGAGLGSAIRAEGTANRQDDGSGTVSDAASVRAVVADAASVSTAPADAGSVGHESAFGRAWDAWWQRRDAWVAKIAQGVLSIPLVFCLILYLSFQNTSTLETAQDGTPYRHTTITYGSPEPWFEYEAFPQPHTPFEWKFNVVSSSMGLMLLGILLYCVSWQIEKARAPLTGKKLRRLGSPESIATFWVAASVIGIAVAMVQPSLLARLYDIAPDAPVRVPPAVPALPDQVPSSEPAESGQSAEPDSADAAGAADSDN